MDQRSRKPMTMYKALHSRNDVDCMCQEKEEENLPAFKIASMQRYRDERTT